MFHHRQLTRRNRSTAITSIAPINASRATDSAASQPSAASQRLLSKTCSIVCFIAFFMSLCELPSLHAQSARKSNKDKEAEVEPPPMHVSFVAPRTMEMLVGLRVTAGSSNMAGTIATTVFPTNWPEQKVEIVEVNMQPPMSHVFRSLPGNNQQLFLKAPLILAGATVEGTIKVRIEKSHIVGPADPSILVIPKRLPRDIKVFTGNSPYIDSSSTQVRKIAREIAAQEPENAWKHVELIYDWVQENIQYVNGKMKDTKETLKDKMGDCEEMTSLFIALCRASDVPARCVWIPNHCYPEFYLEDAEGNGTWFPCQAAGTRSFGAMAEYLPILQKGDRFKVPEKQESQRYLADFLTSQKATGSQPPRVEFIRQLLGDAAGLVAPEPGQPDGTAAAAAAALRAGADAPVVKPEP